MKLYSDGTVNVTGGQNRVDGNGTAFLANVVVGAFISIDGLREAYQISEIVGDQSLRLTKLVTTNGADGVAQIGLSYAISDEFTPWNSLTCPGQHSVDPTSLVNRSLLTIDKAIGE